MQHYLKFLTVLLTLTLLYMPSDKKKILSHVTRAQKTKPNKIWKTFRRI
jgi:hypothetical protein